MDAVQNVNERRDSIRLLIFIVLTFIGNKYNSFVLLFAALLVILSMLYGSMEQNFYYGMFLISNIRMFDNLGVTFIVNVLLAIPLIKYFFKYRFRMNSLAIVSTVALLVIEVAHTVLLGNYDNLVSVISCFISMLFCILVTTNKRININPNKMWKYFVAGIFTSAIVYILLNPWFLTNIIRNVIVGYRLAAYASDPNYYSLYICVALAFVFTKSKYTISDYIVLVCLAVLGMLTASKMCILIMLFIFMVGFIGSFLRISDKSKRRFLLVGLVALMVCIAVFFEEIAQLLENFLRRAGMTGGKFDLSKFTTGRFDILKEYVHILGTNVLALLFGYGLQYHLFLPITGGYGAHNTYFDVILSWGIIGAVIVCIVLMGWKQNMVKDSGRGIVRFLPLVVLAINMLSLSCLSATMIWWMLGFVLVIAYKEIEGGCYE